MKTISLRLLCLAMAAMLAFAFVACDGGSDTPANTSGTNAPASSAADSNAPADTSKADDTSAPADTSTADTEAPSTGTTGLRAIKGTVAAYIDGDHQHRNLKEGHKFGMLANCGGSFKAVNLYTATYDHDNGDQMTIKVFAWNTDYATTVAGEALVNMTITGYPNGGWYMIEFDSALAAGEYLVEISGTSDGDQEHDYGTAVWTKPSTPFVTVFMNGEEMEDGGLWAQLIVE